MKVTVKNSFAVCQGEVAITNDHSKKHILGTFGVSTCVVITVYNPNTKETALTHIDGGTDVRQTILLLLNQLSNRNDLEFNLLIGLYSDYTLNLVENVLKEKNIKIMKILKGTALAIDAKTGNITQHITFFDLDFNNTFQKRLNERISRLREGALIELKTKMEVKKFKSELIFDGRIL